MYADCMLLKKNGITCFDISNEDNNSYIKTTSSSVPKKIDAQPKNIKQIISSHAVDFDLTLSTTLSVEHGIRYEKQN